MISCMGTIGAGTVQGIAGKITYVQENTPKNLFVLLEKWDKRAYRGICCVLPGR